MQTADNKTIKCAAIVEKQFKQKLAINEAFGI